MRSRVSPLLLLGCLASPAAAQDTTYELRVDRDASGQLTCRKTNAGPAGPSTLPVTLRGLAANGSSVSYQLHDAGHQPVGQPVPLSQRPGTLFFEATLPADLVRPAELALTVTNGGVAAECAVIVIGPAPASPPPGPVPAPGPSDAISDADLRATSWWIAEGRQKFLDSLGTGPLAFPKGTQFLVHGPSGAPIAPFPASVSERSGQQIVFIRDQTRPTDLDISIINCPDKPMFRLRGTFPRLAAAQADVESWAAVPVGRTLGCGAGNLVYDVTVKGSGGSPVTHTTNLRVTELYHLAATIFYGFDLAKQPTFSAPNGVVTRTEDELGPGLRLGFTWFPLGIDYSHLRFYNYFLNPFAAFDPTAPKESFVIGNNFTVFGGLSLAIGVSLHRFPVLDGVEEGAAFPGPGDVPTRKDWNRQGRSWYFGVAMDDNVFKALKGLLGGGK